MTRYGTVMARTSDLFEIIYWSDGIIFIKPELETTQILIISHKVSGSNYI